MKILDKTPFQNERGQFDLMGRAQATIRFGFNWFKDLEAQKSVIAQLERTLEKGFVLIRNFTIPDIEAVIPITLVGPGGIYVIQVTNAKGQFEAKGDQWNVVSYGRGLPARENLLISVARYAQALQIYLTRQKIQIPAPIEAILIAANPGAHVDSLRPIVRVVMSDAINKFAATLAQARPVWQSVSAHDIAERIVSPLPPASPEAQAPQMAAAPPAQGPETPQRTPSRASAIFNASDKAAPFDPSDLDFAFEEGQQAGPSMAQPSLRETSPAQPLPRPAQKRQKILGMTGGQLALLAGMIIVECCVIVAAAGVYLYLNQ
jgi:hypothetical protein